MAITDGLIVRVQPVAGDTAIKNLVDNSTFTGTGTPTLVDEGAEKAWQISSGTYLQNAINTVMSNVDGGGKTIVIRLKMTNFGTLSEQRFTGIKELSSTTLGTAGGPQFYRDSSTSRIRSRSGTLMVNANSLTFLNTIVTLVYTPTVLAGDANDVGKMWWNRTDRVGDAADTTSGTNSTWLTKTFTSCFISASDSAQYNLLDFLVYDRQLTEAESSSLTTGANGLRTQIPAPGGTAPTGTVTIGTITPNSTGATVPFTYSAADQTGFEYRLNGGAAVTGTNSPQVLTGLTPSTAYTIEIRAINSSGAGAWSTAANFTTSGVAVSFVGGPVPDQIATVGVPFSLNIAAYFTGTLTPFAYDFSFGNVSGTGLALNASTGMLEGTPTTIASPDLQARSTDTGTNTAVTNLFNITINPAGSPPAGTFTIGTITTTQTTASVPYTYSAADFDSIEYRIDGGTPVTASASPQSLTGLTAGTTYGIEFRAVNAFGNGTWSTSATFTTASVPVGTITLIDLADNTGTIWSNLSGIDCIVMTETATSILVAKTGLTSDADGDVTFNDAAITAGTWYTVVIVSGTNRGIIRIQAT